MARDDYGAISVISDEEREALGIGGRRPDDEEEGLFETIGKAGDKIGETKLGQKLGSILTVLILAFFGGGGDLSALEDIFGGEEEPVSRGGCMDVTAINYKKDATFDNGSCVFPPPVIYGCMDENAINYDPQATHDNNRCNYPPNQNGTGQGNETNTNETVYGCMDIDANNYNDRATEDDGSCDYENEENHCNHTELYAWDGLSHGNFSRPSNHSIDFYMDFDTDCDDSEDPLPILVYYDLVHIFINEDEDGNKTISYDTVAYTEVFLNVSGWFEDEHWFEWDELFDEEFDEKFEDIYNGYWFVHTSYYADFNGNGDYFEEGEYVGYSSNWPHYGNSIEEAGWVLNV